MRVFVTVDIEGIAGVVNGEEGARGNPEYERARRLMTQEANAVVAGIYDADPGAEVTVADVHGPYRNMIPEDLDERATFSRGKPKTFGMVDGIDRCYDVSIFVGVHGRAGSGPAVLSHTFTGAILDVLVNGKAYGELRLREAAARAIRERPGVGPLRVETPVNVEVSFARPVYADLAAMIDGVERVDGRTIRFRREDMPNAYRVLRLLTVLCSTPT